MSETFWECNKAGHKQFTVGVCPDCHREVKYEIAELQAKLDEYAKWDLEDGRTITELKERVSELDELREHFENKFSEQCRINLRLNAALAEIEQIDSCLPNGGGASIQLAKRIARKAREEA